MGGALIAAASAATYATLAIAKQVEETDLLSQKTGIAVQTLQSWSVIMAENNFQAQSLTTGMRTLSKEILEIHNPASTAANAFQTLRDRHGKVRHLPKTRFARSRTPSKPCRMAPRSLRWRCSYSARPVWK